MHHTLESRRLFSGKPGEGVLALPLAHSERGDEPSRSAGWSLPVQHCCTPLVLGPNMPQGHPQRRLSRNRRLLLTQRLKSHTRNNQKYAIASWNLRRLGFGGWGETSWLKLKMVTSLAVKRRWRAILISDCNVDEAGSYTFKGPGGYWLLLFNCRCGILLDPGMAKMWTRGGQRRLDSSDGRSLGITGNCSLCRSWFERTSAFSCFYLWAGFWGWF